jgi:tyrosyl-tRNA synthetase
MRRGKNDLDVESAPLPPDFEEQVARLKRGTLGIVPENGLEEKLARSYRTGKPLKIKLGLDPTAPDIHLGFAVVLRKLRQFQDYGHQVIIIIGDYTALIGDPSGRSATRPMLSSEEIEANGRTYADQLTRILDREKTQIRFNSEWLGKLDFAQVIGLTSKMTVAQVMHREDFANRFAQHLPISLHELLYPLAQAYDSVCIEADIEIGGQDQTFNILAGRDLQKEVNQEQQIALFMPLLVGLDGVKKMSKSLGNYVGIAESADVMFGKLMSISDAMMRDYFVLCTDEPLEEIETLLKQAEAGEVNPKDVKRQLARVIIDLYHPPVVLETGEVVYPSLKADEEWHRIHKAGEIPTDLPEAALPADLARDGKAWVCKLLVSAGMAKSNGEARRLIVQGGVMLNGEKIADADGELALESLVDAVLQVGPRRFVRLKVVST